MDYRRKATIFYISEADGMLNPEAAVDLKK